MNLYEFIDALSDICAPEDIIVPSSAGFASEVIQQAWKVKYGQRIICNPGLGSMGYAIPTAIGASLASGRRVIVIEGDGSLQHSIYELATISRLNLNIKIFVINNGGFASIRNTHEKFFGNNPVSELSFPNIIKLADVYGLTTRNNYGIKKSLVESLYIINNEETLKSRIEAILSNKYRECSPLGTIETAPSKCHVCEVMIDHDQKKELEI
jgi:thiamine pyrophosphate-dependent acetolactate synthase large subunit-like protein